MVELSDWKLKNLISSTGTTELWSCLAAAAPADAYVAKFYNRDRELPEFCYFERQAIITTAARSSSIPCLTYSHLDSATRPILIFPQVAAIRIDEWLAAQNQAPPLSAVIWIFRQLLQGLEAIHALGYVHGNLRPEHVLVSESLQVTIVGLGSCEIVGQTTSLLRKPCRFDAPELQQDSYEASSAQDVYSAAVLLRHVVGPRIEQSTIVSQMLAMNPADRPTVVELLPLFLEMERQFFGMHLRSGRTAAA